MAVSPAALAGDGGDSGGGLQLWPSIEYERGDHRVDLSIQHRYRYESWKSESSTRDGIHGLRSRLGVGYAWKDALGVFVQAQHLKIYSLSPGASGLAANYRANTPGGDESSTDHLKIRQLYLDLNGMDSSLRAGRQDIKMGTLVKYEEADWTYVKTARISQRLVGTVGFTNAERSYDGLSVGSRALDGHFVHAFVAQPTTGVFDVPSAYERQNDITFGGIDWTILRGTCLENTEFSVFGLAYDDGRPVSDGGRSGDVEVYTVGASMLGIHPLGPGRLDVVLWGALQWGDFSTTTSAGAGDETLDHFAGAGLVEVGYRLPDVFGEPWLRVGVNVASGDGDPGDDDHNTFFNLLPTNHGYYGYADQLAFQNLINPFVQLKLKPHRKLGLEVMWHYFKLATRDDAKYAGTGAFNKDAFGYVVRPSGGQSDVGHEIDVTAVLALDEHVELRAGYSQLFGGDVLAGPETRDTQWAYAQLHLTY
ncbi:MAG: alginate export family protein [Myxococcota bacterium]